MKKKYNPLELISIYMDSSTFDQIEKDKKVTLETQLGVIGGTMGLLTGFSILSGIEIIYYICKLVVRFRNSKKVEESVFIDRSDLNDDVIVTDL